VTSRAPVTDAIAFAERVVALLDEGVFVATYKYAVLLGLLDVVLERTSATGEPPSVVTTRQLAEKVTELYWPQADPYGGGGRPRALRQITTGKRDILGMIREFREADPGDPGAPLARARSSRGVGYAQLLDRVEWTLIHMPLPKLQRFGRTVDEFIYRIGWDEGQPRGPVARYLAGQASDFDNRILLRPDVGLYLQQLNGLLRPMVMRSWTAMVARLNELEESALEDFLFGRERIALVPLRPALRELQEGRCFYCGDRLGGAGEVDHFIPWSRYRDDGLDNLVLADRGCNGAKRDSLASARHLRRWRERMESPAVPAVAKAERWPRHPETTLGVARAVYLRLPAGSPLWDSARSFVPSEKRELVGVVG